MKSKAARHGSRLSTKIILMVDVIILISSILFCTVSVYRERAAIRKAIQQRMLDIANCAAGSVDGDLLGSLEEDDVGSDEYNDLYKRLAVFRDNVEMEYVYSIRQDGEGRFIFTMDLDQVSPASYGDAVKYTEALASAGRGVAAVDKIPYSDAWGTFYSAYSPVFDSAGNVAGIIAVDFAADWFDDQLTSQMRSTVLSYGIILLFSLFVAAALSFSTVRPFVRMQGQLLEEKVRAESANHAKSDFLANMSHEIRTPINAVLGMNEMILREGRKSQEIADNDTFSMKESMRNIVEYAGDVENAGHNLLAIVNDILDFSKIEAGRMDLVEAPYRLGSMLYELSGMIMLKARDKGLDLIVDADRSLPDELCGDKVRIRQIFTNILNNAVKYTDRGSVRMTVRGEKYNEGMIILKVSVEDTGIGIKPDDLDKLFKRFQRLDMEKNSTVEGTGLGLVITQRLLEMMDGNITAQSEYGKGSVFTVTIPQKVVSYTPMGDFHVRLDDDVKKKVTARESFRAPKARILVVDDTKINLTVVENLLKKTQIVTDTALGGEEALAMAEKTAYDVILMDQRMPVMDGTEALHRIRATEGGASRNAPVICLTADAVVGARERYLSEGFSDYITKPVDSYALEMMLMKYLPENKVDRYQEKPSEAVATPVPDDIFDPLRSAGIDTIAGLSYCKNDPVLYRTLLEEFARTGREKTDALKKSYDEENWKEYSIYVHAIKSTAKMLGAARLSIQAEDLERSSKAGDGDDVRLGNAAMMENYENVINAIDDLFGDDHASDGGEGDVLEFSPGA